jgi:hypothetical protein
MLREKLIVVVSQVRRHVAVRTSGIARRVWEMDTAEREKIIDPDILAVTDFTDAQCNSAEAEAKGSSHQV